MHSVQVPPHIPITMSSLKKTALHSLHKSKKAVMAEFAGYDMPISYPGMGVLKEHMHTRQAAGLFDVSHMGQYEIRGADREKFVEYATPIDMQRIAPNQGGLTMLTNAQGGLKDDCIFTKFEDHLYAVLNAGCKDKDMQHLEELRANFKGDVQFVPLERSLVALQGPTAAAILGKYVEGIDKLDFMHAIHKTSIKGIPVQVCRCGYTGEDGFEIAVDDSQAIALTELFLSEGVQLIGLGARDSLRLEAGLNLYGHELSEDINPVMARFMWAISKRRMEEGGFIGYERIKHFRDTPADVPRLRVGVVSTGPVAREHTVVEVDGKVVGELTSGCPSPCLKKNIALGYLDRDLAKKGTEVQLVVRDKRIKAVVTPPPFVAHRYFRKPAQ
ncbi:aminomethyltransferase [Angomonas deanei]|uniref:Aminomethyltransferase n=1 Tax=Angomonas deanei TaxID=59799 RepID=A0A7G2C138_9TRYP|nr:aminomethyltransferase [Angomonas deanei]CAD2212911.1 Aminomethyltransferase folate-binding domain/Glycine cleavage T-protein C-terminal barrel domain containing protein, putative [Angomonas deanei]|eukprot:EPY38783.1 aminomethyltransferase [Angomonas deanei]